MKLLHQEKTHAYLCWISYGDIQQEFLGVNNGAIGMLNKLPTGKTEILLIARNSDYGCRFISKY